MNSVKKPQIASHAKILGSPQVVTSKIGSAARKLQIDVWCIRAKNTKSVTAAEWSRGAPAHVARAPVWVSMRDIDSNLFLHFFAVQNWFGRLSRRAKIFEACCTK